MSFEDRLRHDLQAPENLLPPADLADVALAGARRGSRRRAALAAGGVVVAFGVAVSTPVLLHLRAGAGGAPPGSLGCAGAPLSPLTASPSWDQFDPLRYEIDARAVDGYQVRAYSTGRYYQVAELTNQAGDPLLTVTLYSTAGVPHYRTDEGVPVAIDPAAGEPANPVNGATAYWLPDQTNAGPPQEQGLAWQWSPGAWVFVTAASDIDAATGEGSIVDRAALRALAAEAAPELSLGGGTPVTAPFSVSVPSCTRVSGVRLLHGTAVGDVPFTRFGLIFGPDDYVDPTNPLLIASGGGQPTTIDSDDYASPADKPGSVNSTVDGHPAADGSTLVVFDVDGLAFELTGPPGVDRAALVSTIVVYSGVWGPPVA